MKGLGLRLAISLAAAAVMGLSLIDVAFIFWAQGELARSRRTVLYSTANDVLQHVQDPNWLGQVQALADVNNVVISVRNPDGRTYSTTSVLLPAFSDATGFLTDGGMEHVVASLPVATGWQQVWVSRRTDAILTPLYALQRRALVWLLLGGAVIVGVGLVFMRRTVLAPLEHVMDLLFAGDAAALARIGADPRQGLGGLGQAIIGMAHVVEEDRQRIATQLDALQAAHRALEAAQTQLVRAERLAIVGKLSAGLAHEIGNPLAVMAGFVELLRDATLPLEQRDVAVARIEHEVQRIHKTVRQLLDFSRAPHARGDTGDVREALLQLQGLLAPQERWRAIRLLLPVLNNAVPVRLETDALLQILLNLFLNAADALGNKGTFRVALRRLDGGAMALDVEDSGPGIEPAIAARIFEPFFTTKPAGVGTGLGLAVCEGILTAVGGEIKVGRSATLGGAHFTLVLPAPQASSSAGATTVL